MLQTNHDGTKRLLPNPDPISRQQFPNPIMPPPNDEATANAYGLTCQLNVIDYTRSNWIHCDTTREEFNSMIMNAPQQDMEGSSKKQPQLPQQQQQQPAWALASTTASPIQEYAGAILKPKTPSIPSSSNYISSQRLFSNLFLPGSNLVAAFRLLLWIFSPSPEVSILLLDWSSLNDPKPTGGMSPVLTPVIRSIVNGNWMEAKRLVFAQLLVSGQTAGGQDLVLVKGRNDVAIEVLKKATGGDNTAMDGETVSNRVEPSLRPVRNKRNAVLYGAMHCQDLQSKLENLGYSVSKVDWRTCWSVTVPSPGSGGVFESISKSGGREGLDDLGFGLLVLPFYLMIGGLDWLATVQGIAQSLDSASYLDCVAVALFYLVRHVALYLGLAKFVVQWDGEVNLFGTK